MIKFNNMELESYSNGRNKKDVEVAFIKPGKFDPFVERKVDNPTTDWETLTHLLKASLGTGILSMGCAFRSSGFMLGIISTLIIGFISTYCSYTLVKCAHVLYHKTEKTQMSYADVAEAAFTIGPKSCRKFAKLSRFVVDLGLFCIYFGACIAYIVIVAKNFKQILDFYMENDAAHGLPLRWIILSLAVPIIILTLIPDLKYLAPLSTLANGMMFIGLTIIFGWLVTELVGKDLYGQEGFRWIGVDKNETVGIEWYTQYPQTFSITIFAMAAIGVVMPLENKMKNPRNFLGIFGIFSKGMTFVTVVYTVLGALAYLKDPRAVEQVITLEMPMNKSQTWATYSGQTARILISLAVFSSYCLCLFVCLEIIWNLVKNKFPSNPKRANYFVKLTMALVTVFLAFIFPTVTAIISLIGALFLSILGLLVPVIIETVTFWESDKHKIFRSIKNLFITIVAFCALYFGTKLAFLDMVKELLETKN